MGMFVHDSNDFESPYDVYVAQDTPARTNETISTI